MTASIFDTMADAHNTGVLVVVSDTEDEGAAEAAREAARARWREEFRRRLAEQQARSGASGRNEARVHDVLRAADQQVGGYRAQRLRRLWDLVREEMPSHENLPLGIRWNVATRVWGQAGWQVEIACSHDSGIAGIAWTNVGLEALGVGVVSEANFLAAGRQVAWEEAVFDLEIPENSADNTLCVLIYTHDGIGVCVRARARVCIHMRIIDW